MITAEQESALRLALAAAAMGRAFAALEAVSGERTWLRVRLYLTPNIGGSEPLWELPGILGTVALDGEVLPRPIELSPHECQAQMERSLREQLDQLEAEFHAAPDR